MSNSGLLDCIERYHAAAPLPDGRIETVGGLDVPVVTPTWPHPARPRPGAAVTVEDVRGAVALQQAAGLPVALEWIWERSTGTSAAARGAGLRVDHLPLLVLDTPLELLLPHGVRLYLVGAEDPQLPRYQRLVELAFATPRGADGGAGSVEEEVEAGPRTEVLRERIATGRTVMMVAVEDGEPVAVGSHQPLQVDGRELSEVTGVATLPRLRGRGLGAGLASALAAHARETADLVFLTAGDDDVARVYERVGFAWVGTTGVADLP
ncbi:GNAT family N-acetyltransferase [Blastococcus sp. SYSU D00695]